LAGLSAYFRERSPGTKVIGVDAVGSAAAGGARLHRPFKVPGFGSGRTSAFVGPGDWDVRVRVTDTQAVLACRVLHKATGLALGGSSGGAVLGALVAALGDPQLREIGVISADLGTAYMDTIYAPDRSWPECDDPVVAAALDALCQAKRSFEL
jgi:cysteine synthase A